MKNILYFVLPMFLLCSCAYLRTTSHLYPVQTLEVRFSDPASTALSDIETTLIEYIDNSQYSIDLAIYEFKNEEVMEAILRAWHRGVQVRMVGDINNSENAGYKSFQENGIQMRLGNPGRSMHNKYIILDHEVLITGSANYTDTGFYFNHENILVIKHPAVARYYEGDFNTMFEKGLFGMDKVGRPFPGYSNNSFVITNEDQISDIEIYFTPYEGIQSSSRVDNVIIEKINNLKYSLLFSVFSFTHEDMALSMIDAGARGLKVQGIFDSTWHLNSPYSVHELFIQAQSWYESLEVRFDGNEYSIAGNPLSGAKCHNKFIIGDQGRESQFVLTGSYNFSKSSSYMGNDENFVLIHDPVVVQAYYHDLVRQWRQSHSLTSDRGGDDAEYQDIIISEIMWAGSTDNEGLEYHWDDYIELYNNTDQVLNLSGWQLEGTRAREALSYKLIMTIFPEGTILHPHQLILLAVSTNHAWCYTNTIIDPWLFLHDTYSQDKVRLVLKDCSGHIIDDAGTEFSCPFTGNYFNGESISSMSRTMYPLLSGRMETAWSSSQKGSVFIRTGFNKYICASPGTLGE